MLLSILIAHYNNAQYFKDCYDSLLAQTKQDFEIIILDDVSENSEYEAVKNLVQDDTRVKLYKNDKNRGVGYTKRCLIDLSSGDICAFLDPDDALIPEAIEWSLNAYKNQNIIATYSQIYLCDSKLNIQEVFQNTQKIPRNHPMFFNLRFEVAHFFTFKKSGYLKTEGINSQLSSAVDQDLYLKLYEKGNFYFISEPLYLYRIHEKGVSQEKSKKGTLNHNWNTVLFDTLKRRNITKPYGKPIDAIASIQNFLIQKENALLRKILTKLRMVFKPNS